MISPRLQPLLFLCAVYIYPEAPLHRATAGEGMTIKGVNSLRAMQAGTISVSMTGDEVVISLARALNLDVDGYQAS